MKNIKLSHILGGYGVLALSICSATYAAVSLNEYFPNSSSTLQSLTNGWASPINGASKDINTPEGCRKITSTSNVSYHIPTQTLTEWSSFRDNRPNGVNIGLCGSVTVNIIETNVDFGRMIRKTGLYIDRVITLRNEGLTDMTITGFNGLPSAVIIAQNNCTNINPNNTCNITLRMSRDNVIKFVNQSVSPIGNITVNDSVDLTGEIPVTGEIRTTKPSITGFTYGGARNCSDTKFLTIPAGVTSISIVAVGGGSAGSWSDYDTADMVTSGAGGELAYKNNIPVTPGDRFMLIPGCGQVPPIYLDSSSGQWKTPTGETVTDWATRNNLWTAPNYGSLAWNNPISKTYIPNKGYTGPYTNSSTVRKYVNGNYSEYTLAAWSPRVYIPRRATVSLNSYFVSGPVLFGGKSTSPLGYSSAGGNGLLQAGWGGGGAGGYEAPGNTAIGANGGAGGGIAGGPGGIKATSFERGCGGGGTELYGIGPGSVKGEAGTCTTNTPSIIPSGGDGGYPGGGGGSAGLGTDKEAGGIGAAGAIRIVWPGDLRQFPSTDVGM